MFEVSVGNAFTYLSSAFSHGARGSLSRINGSKWIHLFSGGQLVCEMTACLYEAT